MDGNNKDAEKFPLKNIPASAEPDCSDIPTRHSGRSHILQRDHAQRDHAHKDGMLKIDSQNEPFRDAGTELGLSYRRFSELYKLAPVGCLFLDKDGRVTDINIEGTHILGIRRKQVTGKSLIEFVPAADRSRFTVLMDSLLSGHSFSRKNIRISSPENNDITIRASALPVTPGDDSPSARFLFTFAGIFTPQPHAPAMPAGQETCAGCDAAGISGSALETADQYHDASDREGLCSPGEKLRVVSQKTMRVLENDRKMIAREIHDNMGGSLAAIKFLLEDILSKNGDNPQIAAPLNNTVQYIADAIQKARDISANLRPAILDDLGLKATLQWHCRRFRESRPGISLKTTIDVDEESIPDSMKIVVYRIIQEAMDPLVRHGSTTRIWLSLIQNADRINMEIQGNGIGAKGENASSDASRKKTETEWGLSGIKEKVEICGGSFSMNFSETRGLLLRVSLPMANF